MNVKGFGFLRDPSRHYVAQPSDAYVPAALISKLRLAEGLHLTGRIEPSKKGVGPRMAQLETIEGQPPDAYKRRAFDDLTPIDPHEQIRLETGQEPVTMRSGRWPPIGKGTRGLIRGTAAQARPCFCSRSLRRSAIILKCMSYLLVDERPESDGHASHHQGEVIASSSDRDSFSHIHAERSAAWQATAEQTGVCSVGQPGSPRPHFTTKRAATAR